MKELLNQTNKSEWLLTGIYRVSIYICWYLFACVFATILQDEINDIKLIVLVLFIIILYIARNFLKALYKKNANNSYYNLKHAIEMYYFNKLKSQSYEHLEKIDKEELSNKILEVSYNYTKIVSDIFEYIIPALIGLFLIFLKLIELNMVFGVIAFACLLGILYYSYYNLHDEDVSVTNYNDLLKDFILKIHTIKKLNIFDYCQNKLNETKENDICILKNNDTINDIKLSNFVFIFTGLVLISTFIFVRPIITRLGVIIFFIIITLKLQDLLFKFNPAIKNMFQSTKNRTTLENLYAQEEQVNVNTNWKKITIKDGLTNYNDTTEDIKIPSFELLKNDHISILGAKGEGKSTICNVLSGIFKLNKGTILFDEKEVNDIVDAMYISKDIEILNISLRDNLKFNKEITDEELINYISSLNLSDWYNSLPNKLDEILPNDLDRSIIERINIIRAIISDKDVYFFDEPIPTLDADSEKKVVNLLKKYMKDKTFIIISKKTALTNLCKKHYFIKNHTLLEKEPLL